MKAIILSIDTSKLNELRRKQSNIIRRSYNLAIDGHSFQYIDKHIPLEIDGHLHRCGVQRGIDLANTSKSMIFGGKKQFIRRCKGLISHEEWKEYRIQPLYSVGQANTNGNRKFRIKDRKLIYKDSETYYEWNIPKLKPNWEVILEELIHKSNNKEIALTYIVSKDKISIIYDEQKLECFQKKYIKYKKKEGRYIGIDLNPDRIGIAVYSSEHDPYANMIIHAEQYELMSDNQDKRRNELSHICDAIYKTIKHYNVSRCGMEELTIKSKEHNKGKRFNKKVNFWIRNFIINKMKMICQLTGCIFCNINPAYSSFIGTLRNPSLGDCCGAAAEIARRCAYQKSEFYPRLIKSTTLVHRWKEMADVEYDSWIGLYKEFKTRHLGWRSPPYMSRSSNLGAWSKRLLIHSFNNVSN